MAFFDFVGKFIAQVFLDGWLWGMIKGIFKLVRMLGLIMLKVLTDSKSSMEKLDEKYQDSIKPYWIGFTILFMLIYLVVNLL